MIFFNRFVFIVALFAFFFVSCSSLPSYGPSRSKIFESLGKQEKDTEDVNALGVKLIDINSNLSKISKNELEVSSFPFRSLAPPRPVDNIVPGDILSISIFEAGAGLFNGSVQGNSNSEVGSSSAGSTTIPRLTVTRNGMIFLPYIGQLRAAGLTTSQIASDVLKRLKGKASQPQVLVERILEVGNRVVILGDTSKPGRYPLSLAHEQLLDIIAEAGGPTHTSRETTVTLMRRGKKAMEQLSQLYQHPEDDVALEDGDLISLQYTPRTYMVFGAAGRTFEFPFETEHVSLAQGIARAGGLQDFQADPRGVFIFRMVSRKSKGKPEVTNASILMTMPIIYHADFSAPASYFLAQNFELQDKDLIYISDAPSMSIQKVLTIVNGVFSPVATSRSVAQ